MFNTVKKKLRDGPGPNSYKQDADILDEYYNNGDSDLGGSLGGLGGSLGTGGLGGSLGAGVLSENFDTELFHRKDDGGGSSSIFGMDDVGLSSSFKETMTIHSEEPPILSPGGFSDKTAGAAGPAGPGSGGAPKTRKPASSAATSAAAALGGQKDTDMGPPRAMAPHSKAAPSAAAMMGGGSAAAALTSMSTPMSAVGLLGEREEGGDRRGVRVTALASGRQALSTALPCQRLEAFSRRCVGCGPLPLLHVAPVPLACGGLRSGS